MNQQLHNELRKEFQLERLILFSDAVFAIAITLLIIEVKVPDLHEVVDANGVHVPITDPNILKTLGHLIPKFMGFMISFMLIGLYWTVHHRLFGFVTSYNKGLIILNLVFLFFIVLMPFSTALYSEYAGLMVKENLKVPLMFYVLNFCGAGLVNYTMWRYISNPKHKLTTPPIDPLTLKYAKMRAATVPIVFLLMIPVALFIHVLFAVYIPLFIPIIMKTFKRNLKKQHPTFNTIE